MNKLLKIFSYIVFFALLFAAGISFISTLGGVVTFIAVLFNFCGLEALQGFAITYFGSITIMLLGFGIFKIYTKIAGPVEVDI